MLSTVASMRRDWAAFWADHASYPFKSHDLWFITESVRWGFLPKETLANAKALIDKVNREDIWKEAAKEAGIAQPNYIEAIELQGEQILGVRIQQYKPTFLPIVSRESAESCPIQIDQIFKPELN